MAVLAVVMLAMFGQVARTYAIERAAHARAVTTSKGKRMGWPIIVELTKLEYAAHLRDEGFSFSQILEKAGITSSSRYRNLPPRPPESLTAAP